MVFAIKMLLDNTFGLPNLFEFKSDHFNSLFLVNCEFKIQILAGIYFDTKIWCWFWIWFSLLT